MKVLIDGDIIVYSAGFAAETSQYLCADGKLFRYKRDAKEHCELWNLDVEEIERIVDPEPLENVLHNVSSMIKNIVRQTGADEHQIFLSGVDNFREEVATIRPYKGTRDSTHKPFYYNKIKEYIINNEGRLELK